MTRETKILLIWVFIFSFSMAFFESSIVVYLREIYYPEGFTFPLAEMSEHLVVTEFFREFASLVMIISVSGISFKSFYRRFAGFLFVFAIWDIFYYVFLKVLLDWPESLMEWDILFLIPVTWTGPVITPVFISILMLILASVILIFYDKLSGRFAMNAREWITLIIGAFVVFISFIWDYSRFLINKIHWDDLGHLTQDLEVLTLQYEPQSFNWPLFIMGSLIILLAIFIIYRRNLKFLHEHA